MNILVTGATGFIGQAFCQHATMLGHRILALCKSNPKNLPAGVEIAIGDLATTPWPQIARFKPDIALHLAWITTPGKYLDSSDNEIWLNQSVNWFRILLDLGVKHLVSAGTCIEYAPSLNPLDEFNSLTQPLSPYARAKHTLHQWLEKESLRTGTDMTWLRIFYPYGPKEHRDRLCSTISRQLKEGKKVILRTPHSVKDYIFVDDVALAICHCLQHRIVGAVNIGSGSGISVMNLAITIAQQLNTDLALVQALEEPDFDPNPVVIASIEKLQNAGWSPTTSLLTGLKNYISSH